jgi:D-alanine-D-alanine ligase
MFVALAARDPSVPEPERRKAIDPSNARDRGAMLLLGVAPTHVEATLRDAQRSRFAAMAEALRPHGLEVAYRELGELDGLLDALRELRPDLAYSSFTGLWGSQARGGLRDIREVLQLEGVPYLGSAPASIALSRSKSRLKRQLQARGINTPSSFCVRRTKTGSLAGRKLLGAARDFPYIVKPDGEDESRGIHARSIAFEAGDLLSIVEASLEEYDELLVEHFVGGASSREFTVAMIGNGEGALMLPAEIALEEDRPIRVVTREDRERGLAIARPVADEDERERIGGFARRAFEAAGVRDYARCDLIDEGGRLFALEVNPMPRMPDPWFDVCAQGAGLGRGQYVTAIVLAAIRRSGLPAGAVEAPRGQLLA